MPRPPPPPDHEYRYPGNGQYPKSKYPSHPSRGPGIDEVPLGTPSQAFGTTLSQVPRRSTRAALIQGLFSHGALKQGRAESSMNEAVSLVVSSRRSGRGFRSPSFNQHGMNQ